MPDLNFLTVNPVTAGIESAQRMEAQRQRGELVDLQVQDARAKRAQERAASEALNNIYATGGQDLTTEQVHRRLAADPNVGGGRRLESLKAAEDSSLKRTQIEAQARERDSRQLIKLIENRMDGAAAELANRMGLKIPPDFWQNEAKRRALLEKAEADKAQADIAQKRASARASQALAESRRPDSYTEYVDNEGRLVRVDRASGKASFVMGPDNQPLRQQNTKLDVARTQAESREAVAAGNQSTRLQVEEQKGGREGGRGGRPLDREVRLNQLIEAGIPRDEALRIASGVAITPQQIAAFKDRALKRVQAYDPQTGQKQFRTPAEQNAEVERQVQVITGGAAQTGARSAPAPAAAGGAPKRRRYNPDTGEIE